MASPIKPIADREHERGLHNLAGHARLAEAAAHHHAAKHLALMGDGQGAARAKAKSRELEKQADHHYAMGGGKPPKGLAYKKEHFDAAVREHATPKTKSDTYIRKA